MYVDESTTKESLLRMIRRITPNTALREDLLPEALIHLWLTEARRPGQTKSWYLQSCKYHLLHYLASGRSVDSGKRRASQLQGVADFEMEPAFPDQSEEALERVRSVLGDGPMKVWWVNQGQSYRPERDGWFVWAPLQTKAGRPVAHHSNVSRLRPGDAVVHYSQGFIRAIGEVIGPPVERRTRPADLPGWGR